MTGDDDSESFLPSHEFYEDNSVDIMENDIYEKDGNDLTVRNYFSPAYEKFGGGFPGDEILDQPSDELTTEGK
jgi:hypothetical protein